MLTLAEKTGFDINPRVTSNEEEFAKWIVTAASVPGRMRNGLDRVDVTASLEPFYRDDAVTSYEFVAKFAYGFSDEGRRIGSCFLKKVYLHHYEKDFDESEIKANYFNSIC